MKTAIIVSVLLGKRVEKIRVFGKEKESEANEFYMQMCNQWYNEDALCSLFGDKKLEKEDFESYELSETFNNCESVLVYKDEVVIE